MFVYRITNAADGKIYIGITTGTIEKRWREHRCAAKSGDSKPLYRAMRKYGAYAFRVELLYEATSKQEMFAVERGLIAQYGARSKILGYNLTDGGEGAAHEGYLKGADNSKTKLTIEAVRFLRDQSLVDTCNENMAAQLFERFGLKVSRDCVRDARRGDSWRHMNRECPPIKIGQGKRMSDKRASASANTLRLPHVRSAMASANAIRMKGSRITAKLTEDQVRAIYLDPRPNREIERAYKMSHGTAKNIKMRRCWASVTGDLNHA